MKHKEIERLIQKSLDHETNEEEERALRLHLSGCDNCRKLYQELTQIEQGLGELIEFYPRHDFNDRVLRELNLKKSLAWKKVTVVFAGSWLASILFLVFSPWTRGMITNLLTSTPMLVRLFDKIHVIAVSFGQILTPLAKSFFNPTYPVIGLIFSIVFIYFFSKILHPIRKIEGNTGSPSKRWDLLRG